MGRKVLASRLSRSVVVAGAGLVAFLGAFQYLDSDDVGIVTMRADAGQKGLYFVRPLAADAKAVLQRATELRQPPSDSKMRKHSLAEVGNEDWLVACTLVDEFALRLSPLVEDGEPGPRPEKLVIDLLQRRSSLRALVERFRSASMLADGPVGAEMKAFLEDALKLMDELAKRVR